jgi:hypothetical protein
MVLTDRNGQSGNLTLGASGCPQTLPPATYITYCRSGAAILGTASFPGCGFVFGIGGSDRVDLYLSASDSTRLDTTGSGCCANSVDMSYGRTSLDGSGPFAVLPGRTPGAPNVWTVVISEIADQGNANDACNDAEYIEPYNPTSVAVSLVNLVLRDDYGHGVTGGQEWCHLVLGGAGCPQSLPASTYMSLCREGAVTIATPTPQVYATGCSFGFGIGGSDTVNLSDWIGIVSTTHRSEMAVRYR